MRAVLDSLRHVVAERPAKIRGARGEPARREGVLLCLRDAQGRRGLGEASPLPGFSPDTAVDCARVLDEIGRSLDVLDERAPPALAIELALAPWAPRLTALPAARFALETALLDLLGQRLERSIAALLGGVRPYDSLRRSGLLPRGEGAEGLIEAAQRLVSAGFRTLKLKVGDAGASIEREAHELGRLREAIGPSIALRLDANGAWAPAEARARLSRLSAVRPEFVEEPASGEDLVRLGACAVPWAADESLADPGRAARLLPAPGCRAIVLKPALLGGLLAARALACEAERLGLGVVVTHLFDGPVGLAAACELALSLPRAPLDCGLDAHDALGFYGAPAPPQLRRSLLIVGSTRPGLGLCLER